MELGDRRHEWKSNWSLLGMVPSSDLTWLIIDMTIVQASSTLYFWTRHLLTNWTQDHNVGVQNCLSVGMI